MARDRDDRRRQYEVDDGATRQQKHSSGARSSLVLPEGLAMFRPKKTGNHSLEIIPFYTTAARDRFVPKMQLSKKVGVWYPERTYYVHGGVGVNNETYACPAMNFGKPCPICEVRRQLLDKPDKDSRERAYGLKPKERQLFLILDNDEPQKGIQLWDEAWWNFGKHLDKYIAGADPEDREAYRMYFHPLKGYTLRVTASEEQGDRSKYTIYTIHQFKARREDLADKLFDHGFDLDATVRDVPYKELKATFEGLPPDEDKERGRDDDRQERSNPRSARDEDDDRRPTRRDERDEERAPARTSRDEPDGDRRPSRTRDDDEDRRPARREEPDREAPKEEARRSRDDDDGRPTRHDEPKKEEKKPAGAKWQKDDEVTFEYKNQEWTGRIVKVDTEKEMISVQVEGRDRPMMVDFDDQSLRLAGKKPKKEEDKPKEKDREPEPKKEESRTSRSRKDSWDDDDDRSFSRDDDRPRSRSER